uniref:UBC core domain-containing protein n=1 Tax=Panagrolaimus superbus TaxID=310955 RepID=A0A914ZBD2_9BILA
MQSERIDEIALSMISALKYSKKSIMKEIGESFPSHPSLKQVMELLQKLQINQPFTSDILEAIYFLVKSRPVKSIATQTRVMNHKTAIAALESYLQHSLGFQMTSPPHWTENVRSLAQKAATTVDTSISSHSQKTSKEISAKDDQPFPTRAWKFLPEKEKPKPAYVFKMAIIPGMPLSHINFKFTFANNSNGSPDALFTIYRSKESFSENSLNGMESNNLIPYCDDSSLLDSECEKMLGPYRIDNCVNSDNTHSLIQISSTVILEALSAAHLKEEWFTKPVFLYLLIEVLKRPSLAQQINSRTQLIAQAAKTRSRSDKARVSRSSGGYKKKFHPRKAFVAKNTKTSAPKNVATSSACRLAIIKRKDTSSSRRQCESPISNEPKEGFLYIEEFSVTLYRCQKQPNGHEQLQRIILQKDNQIHKRLFEIALREDFTTLGVNTVSSIQKTQLQALDLLIWITQGWRLSSNYLPGVLELLEAFVNNYKKVFISGFVNASSQVSQKWNTLLGQLLKIVNNQETVDCEALFTQLINLMKKSLLNDLGKIEKSGSLHWFLATVFTVVYESTYLLIEGTHITAANQLAETCIAVLQKIGDAFQKKWNSSMHQTLSTKYGLSGLIFELNLFEFPQQLLGYRTANESFAENEKISSIFKQPQNPMINPVNGYNPAGFGGPLGYLSHINPPKPYRELSTPNPVTSDGEASVSGKLFPYCEHETLSLMEMLNLNIGYGDDLNIKQPWMASILSEGDWFDIDDKILERSRMQNDLLSRYTWSRFSVGSEFLSGLMEMEPLSFECTGSSDYTNVYNCDTQSFSNVSLSETNLLNSSTKAPEIQRVIASIKNLEFNNTANYQLSNEIFSIFKPPCDYVLSVERVAANSTRQIILDFGGPTLLKSFIIPPSEYVQVVQVDGWWNAEEIDSIRIAQSKTIKNKALIISNMQPGILVRKLKLTFIMKGTTGKARVPVGRYFGTKWLSESDVATASVPFTASTGDPIIANDLSLEAPLADNLTRMLQYFCEEVRCRYNIAAAELKKLIEEGYSAVQVKDAYVLCFNLRLQWNISYNVMEKLQNINQIFVPKENKSQKEWNELDMEHLKSLCSYMLNFSNELTNVLDLRDSTREILVQAASQTSRETDERSLTPVRHIQPTEILDLETAISFFDFYCTHNVPSIKSIGCAQLFKSGCFTSWWGNIFPELLSKYFFVLDNNSIDNETFLVLSILCSHSVKHSHLQQTVMEKLFNFIIDICKELMLPDLNENGVKNNSSLLSWTLQLLSTSFDVVACNKRKSDRWMFLSGLFGQSSTYAPSIQSTIDSAASSRILSTFDQMTSRDKILSRWKEVFNYDDFLTELEKPQFIARRLDILADRLHYLHALIREEEIDGIPAVLPPKRESFSLPISAESIPNKAPSPPLPDTSSTRLLIVPLHNLQSRVRVRQYSARLKISETLCLSVVQHLLDLLLHEKSGRTIPYSSQLLAVKVISKICLHGSVSSIPLTCALGEKLHDFVFKMLKASKEYEWMRYALLMLLIDLTDAEIRSFGRNVSQRQMRTVVEEDIGVEAKRHKVDTEIEMSEENSINNELSDHAMEDLTIPETDALSDIVGPDGSATAIFAGVNDSPWAFVSPSTEFVSFSNFDRVAFEQVDENIFRAAVAVLIGMKDVNPLFLSPIPSKNITEQTRFSTLLQWYFRLARYFYDRGESLTHIFRFFDEATIGEEEHYLKCLTEECYSTTYSLAIFENTRLGPLEESEKSDKSISAQAFISFCNNFLSDESKSAALVQPEKSDNIPRDALDLRFYQATIEAKYHLRLCGMRHLCREMQIGDVELQKAINGHMVRIRFKLPELTSMALDANGDKMVSADPDSLRAFDMFAVNAIRNKIDLRQMLKNDASCLKKVLNVYSKILFINVTWPDFEDFTRLTKHAFSEQTLVEMASAGETPPDLSSIGQSIVEPIQPLETLDEVKCALENLTNEVQVSAKIRQLNQAVHLQFSADLAVAGDNILVQPSELTINFLVDMQFGFQPIYEASYREQIRGTLARNCMYNFVPHCITTRKSGEENKETSSGLGQSVKAVVNVVNLFLSSLQPDTSAETLLNVLTFYLEYTGYVHCITGACNSTKTILLEKGAFEPPPLSYEALFKLLNFVTVNNNISEELWQNVLTSFTRNIRKDIANPLLSSTSASFNLRQFLQKFFSDSLHAYGIGTGFGPTSLEHMGTLLSKLLASDSVNGKYLEQFIDALSCLFADPSSNTFGALPIETLSAIIDIVGQSLKVYTKDNTCDIQKISFLLYRVVQMMRVAFPRFDGYLRNCSTHGRPPGSSSTQLSQANMCFTSISPPSSLSISPTTQNVSLSNTVKLPELSFVASKATSPETTNSFRRAKNPAKMWQASAAASDPFDYEGFESGFDTMRAYTSEQVYEKPNVDRTEMLFVLLIKFINTCSQLGPVWTIALQRYPQTITVLIDLLNECESAVDPVTEVNIEFWSPQTLADHLLYILLAVSNAVGVDGDNARRFMQVSLQTIFKENTEKNEITKISDPLIFALMKLNYQIQRKELFVLLDGHQHIAEQLKKWQQLKNVSNEVVGIVPQTFDVNNLPAKIINGSKVFNFHQLVTRINGHSINTSSLANILMDPIPHRRSRHAAYAYTFPQGELWTSVTISLPCQIMLSEVQIKCHQYSLNTPSAIQLELSSDVLPARHWALFGGNFVTAGLISTIIDTTRHQLPVGALKLHLRRPNGHTGTINLSQIIIYGIVTSPKMIAQAEKEKSLINWLTLYDKFQTVQPSLWQYASMLPQKLMQLFIQMSNDHKIYALLRQVISNIDYRAKSNESTIIELILKHVFSGGRLSDGISPVISAEMLYSFCTEPPQRAAIRQQQLLAGIEHLLTLINDKAVFDDTTFAIILWSAACIIWNNVGNETLRYQTVASCLEVGTRIQDSLFKLAISTSNNHKLIKPSAAWLLCSLFRADPNLARSITEKIWKQNKLEFSNEELFVLSKVYQSESAAMELINSGMLMKFVQETIKLSKEVSTLEITKLTTLINYIEFLAELCVIDVVCVFLQEPACQELFKTLLPALVYCIPIKTVKETLNIFGQLNKATVSLCQRCIAYSNELRKVISNILTELLADEKTRFCGRIDGTLLQLVLRLVLEDEFITLRIKGLQGPNYANDSFSSRIVHPVFGCVSTDRIFSASLFTFLRDMVPLRQSELSKLKMTLAGMYDEMSTFDSFMTSHKKKMEPEIQEPTELSDGVVCDELGQKQLVARIFCEQLSSNNSLSLKRNLKDIFWQTSIKDSVKYVIEEGGKISKSTASDFKTFGYLTLLMEVRVTNHNEGASVAEDLPEIPSDDLTILQHFALVGGFSQLSSHFPMADHYSSVLERYEGLCKKQRESNTKSSHGPTAENAAPPKPPKQSMNQVAFASQFQQQLGHVLGQAATASSNLQAMIAGTPVSLSVLEPSAIVGFQNGGDPSGALAAVMPSNFPVSSSAGGFNDNSFQSFGNALNFMINNSNAPSAAGPFLVGGFPGTQPSFSKTATSSALNYRQNLGADKEVPAYTIFALSMFLKLDYYAITLVTCDRFQAKRVLRAAMGLATNEREMSSIMSSFRPILPKSSATSCPIIVNQLPERKIGCAHINGPAASFLSQNRRELEKSKRETENLTIYPFYVLEKVFILSSPKQCNKEISSKIRFSADKQGILDVILLCTSRISNTSPRWQISFPPSSEAQAIDQIFQLSDQIDTLRDQLSAPPTSTPLKQFHGMTSALMQPHEALMMGSQQHGGQQDFFPKGTGFGSGTTQVQWNLNEHVRRRKLSEEAVTCMINIISGYLNPVPSIENCLNDVTKEIGLIIAQIPYDKAANFHKEPLNAENQIQFSFSILSKIYNSCLMPVIHSYLTNDSVFDISKHVAVYEACIWFVITVASLKPVEASENELQLLVEAPKTNDIFASMLMEEYHGISVFSQMKKMHEMIKVYLSTIDKERKPEEKSNENEKNEDSQEEENLEALAILLQKALIILEHRLNPLLAAESEAMEVDNETKDIGLMSLEDVYIEAMKNIQYESIPFFKSDDNKVMEIPHHYSSTFLGNTSTGNQKRWRRLAQETITLSSSLPLTASSSVFMKACEERLDVYKLIITGPPGTPYSNGCFEFDAHMPSDYPNVPLQISLQTTGGNSVRFNPNLYNDGKVCLSILNTWHGRPEERWNAETSSFLQVIVSIQSLILVNEPYFNEPGYERSRNTPAGQQASRDYDANIRNQTVRWAMLEQIRYPPKGFEEIIRRHFWIKRDEICEQIEEWIGEMQKLVDTATDQSIRVTKSSLSGLTKNFEDLKTEFSRMKAPEGLEKLVSKYFPNGINDITNEATSSTPVNDESAKSQK